MNKNRLNFPEIQDTHLDQMIRLAFEQETALWAQQLIAESEKPLTSEQQEHADRMLVRMMVQIDQEERTVRRRNKIAHMKRMVPRLIEVAACIVLIIGIAAPFAIANVESIRSAVMKMLIRIDWEKGEMQMNLFVDRAAEWHSTGTIGGRAAMLLHVSDIGVERCYWMFYSVVIKQRTTCPIQRRRCAAGVLWRHGMGLSSGQLFSDRSMDHALVAAHVRCGT